jgi:hypothetical protein
MHRNDGGLYDGRCGSSRAGCLHLAAHVVGSLFYTALSVTVLYSVDDRVTSE